MNNIDTSKWKQFRLEELFSATSGDTDIKKEHINGLGLPVITAGTTNYGILGKSDVKAKEFPVKSFTVDMFGKCYYRYEPYKMVTHARVFALFPKYEISDEIGLFIETSLNKVLDKFSYSNMCSWSKIKDLRILLPVEEDEREDPKICTKSEPDFGKPEEIDWEYMQERIAELQQERIAELDAYLKVTGLENYELTEEDEEVLNQNVSMIPFKIGNLFERVKSAYKGNGKKQENVSKIKTSEFSLPLINCKNGHNGIMYYGKPSDFESHKMVLSIIYNGPPTEGQTYFQREIGLYTDAYIVKLKNNNNIRSEEMGLYLTAAINRSIHDNGTYSRGFKATWDKVQNDYVMLPVRLNNNVFAIDKKCNYHPSGYIPDFDFMEKYIKAIEKKVIAGVVQYKNKVIEETEKIIGIKNK